MKTPDEIKKGLEKCSSDRSICNECEFSSGNAGKWQKLMGYALTYIQQLEATVSEKENVIAELLEKIEQLKRERDYAVDEVYIWKGCARR